ncbi:signal peptidase I [Vagococcus jeotgali]|uniref:signal peptidase I n=1 Tax=Vagococcus jeotgali TaxID=3109030 RepID=UPI00351CD171
MIIVERVGDFLKRKWIDILWHWVKMFVLCTVVVFIIRAFIFVPLEVSGSSMSPTLKESDFVVMENFSEIKRFDIIVFYSPDGSTYVKRVIGLPGEQVTYKKDQLYINGEKIEEPFLKDIKKKKNEYVFTTDLESEEIIGSETIPENQYFVLGDNRRLSKDSRSFGTISEQSVIGKVKLVYYPVNHMKIIKR